MSWNTTLDTWSYQFYNRLSNAKKDPAYVYFITDGRYVKIGVANDVLKRILELQTGNGSKLFPLIRIYFPFKRAAYLAEHALHKEFSDKQLVGEWFDIANDKRLFYYFFRQRDGAFSDEAMRFILTHVVRTGYSDPYYYLETFKYKYLDWYDPEGRKKKEVEDEWFLYKMNDRYRVDQNALVSESIHATA